MFYLSETPRLTMSKSQSLFRVATVLALISLPGNGFSASGTPVPEEYESTGGQSLAFGGSVVTGLGGASAIRANPALMSLEKEYSVNGAYHWPTAGRDFYQVGVVDSKTSSVAAGFTYTGAQDNYQGLSSQDGTRDSTSNRPEVVGLSKDSPVVKRASLAFALPVGKVFLGAGGSFVEARSPTEALMEDSNARVKGFTMGFGLAGHLTDALRIGISAENLANKKVQYAAPTFYRAGASYFMGGLASIHLDYRRREAVPMYEGRAASFTLDGTDDGRTATIGAENFLNASASVRIYDLLRVIMATGQVRSAEQSATRVAGGLALVNQNFNFSYQALKPSMAEDAVHHALSLGFNIMM
jgi:hypothetical protein